MGCKGTKKRREWETEKYEERTRKIKRFKFTNKFINAFLESSIGEDESSVIKYISNCALLGTQSNI